MNEETTKEISYPVELAKAALELIDLYPKWRDDPREEDLKAWDKLEELAKIVYFHDEY